MFGPKAGWSWNQRLGCVCSLLTIAACGSKAATSIRGLNMSSRSLFGCTLKELFPRQQTSLASKLLCECRLALPMCPFTSCQELDLLACIMQHADLATEAKEVSAGAHSFVAVVHPMTFGSEPRAGNDPVCGACGINPSKGFSRTAWHSHQNCEADRSHFPYVRTVVLQHLLGSGRCSLPETSRKRHHPIRAGRGPIQGCMFCKVLPLQAV